MQKDSIEAMHQNWNPLVQEACLSSLAREDTVKSLTSNLVYCNRCYHSVVCLSVCLTVMFMHCAQTAENIDKTRQEDYYHMQELDSMILNTL